MAKILSQAGNSLADVYDVEGSIAGIEQLETADLGLIHEMGATVFSERFTTVIRRIPSGNVTQNQNIGVTVSDLPTTPTRILGCAIITDDASRLSRASLSVREPLPQAQEFPVWVWDGTNNLAIRLADDGGAADFELLVGQDSASMLPSFGGGNGQPGMLATELRLVARTTGFGAGTVFVTGLVYTAQTDVGGISSRGLPIPSW